MKELKDLYNRKIVHNNMTYSIDMIRLKTYLTYDIYNEIDAKVREHYFNKEEKKDDHSQDAAVPTPDDESDAKAVKKKMVKAKEE